MAPKHIYKKTIDREADTHEFAQKVAEVLRPADILLLEGEIGAGKTSFARALIQFLLGREGLLEDVPSPSFTLVQTYQLDGCEIWHSDLYRLSHPDEVEELGLIDAFSSEICLVEWPDRLGDLAPPNALTISFGFDVNAQEQQRVLELSFDNPRWNVVAEMM